MVCDASANGNLSGPSRRVERVMDDVHGRLRQPKHGHGPLACHVPRPQDQANPDPLPLFAAWADIHVLLGRRYRWVTLGQYRGSLSLHSFNENDFDEGDPAMGRKLDEKLTGPWTAFA